MDNKEQNYVHVMNSEEMQEMLKHLIKNLEKKTHHEIKQLNKRIEEEHAKRLQKINEDYDLKHKELVNELDEIKRQELEEKKALFNIELKRNLNAAKEKAVENAITEIKRILIRERGKSLISLYTSYCLAKFDEHFKEFDDFKIICGEVEYNIFSKEASIAKKLVINRNIHGFIISSIDEKIDYDYTIESLIDSNKELLKSEIHSKLFSEIDKK
ncbi:MAG: hypothetical protein N3E37_04890 [Candidatus Micrarchaeota archaeon]|nr:hypothetical protein [Candidatus Micrarchaeota archaeon]